MIKPGLIAIHGNRLELLAATILEWMGRYPMGGLEREIILTPSHALGEWVKMQMADDWGVCAALQVELPGRVLWGLYRRVINQAQDTGFSPTDREALVWRVMRLIAKNIERNEYLQIKSYWLNSPPSRHYELAKWIADLLDQYQVYRSDWLKVWGDGKDVLIDQFLNISDLALDQRWQAHLWREILLELSPEQAFGIRPNLHASVMHELNCNQAQFHHWPKRLILFGFSSLPQQVLEFLSALSKKVQVILCINSPCQYHWGDIATGRELFLTDRHRLKDKGQVSLSNVKLSEMHAHANPILASWGHQSRDFIRLLDRFDSFETSFNHFDQMRVDVFDSEEPVVGSLLESIQHQIRDLQPIAEIKLAWEKEQISRPAQSNFADGSLVFHIAHGLTRELEILHDQLLMMLSQDWALSRGIEPIEPKDIVVMLPQMDSAVPSIEAIFGQYNKNDSRHIPFSISDHVHLLHHPVVGAMKWLCQIQSQKVGLSEILEIIKIPCVAKRFGFDPRGLEILESWLEQSGARWGLNAWHRQELGFAQCGHTNTLLFGLQRMVLGYLSGSYDSQPIEHQDQGWIQPHPSVQGLDVQVVGHFALVLEALISWWKTSSTCKTAKSWVSTFAELMNQWMEPQSAHEQSIHLALKGALVEFESALEAAQYSDEIVLEVAGLAWLEILKLPPKKQRLRASGVSFCAMKTMRSVPFKVICLLGLNEGDFPQSSPAQPFDLVQLPGQKRPGDRSRKEDDRALMLEALLSARQTLYISWSGFGVRDNAYKSPSVLVTQLRQYLRSIYGEQVLDQLTTVHPAQPFGRNYFDSSSSMWTYAKEWEGLHGHHHAQLTKTTATASKENSTPAVAPNLEGVLESLLGKVELESLLLKGEFEPLALHAMIAFTKNPCKYFFRHELSIGFEEIKANLLDREPMSLRGLELYGIKDELLSSALVHAHKTQDLEFLLNQKVRQLGAEGRLSLGELGHEMMQDLLLELRRPVASYWEITHAEHHRLERVDVTWCDSKNLELLRDSLKVHQLSDTPMPPFVLELTASRLFKQKKIRFEQLLAPWLTSAYLACCGYEAMVKWIFSDAMVSAQPMPFDRAQGVIQSILRFFHFGQYMVLPVPFKTAMAFVQNGDLDKARTTFEGDPMSPAGDFSDRSDPSWAREYANFGELLSSPRVSELWQHLYQPLLEWSQDTLVIEDFDRHDD